MAEEETIKPNSIITLHSLSKEELNGRTGRVEGKVKDRYKVILDGFPESKPIAVRARNIQIVDHTKMGSNFFTGLDLRGFTVGAERSQSSRLCTFNMYSKLPADTKATLMSELCRSPEEGVPTPLSRATAALVGCAIADAAGHPFEFMDVVDKVGDSGHVFSIAELSHNKGPGQPLNRFALKPGQWTDDASMALCMADSLVANVGYNGSDIRARFWNWWFMSYNTAFGNDDRRPWGQTAVGLGGNISKSIYSCKPDEVPTPIFESHGEDSGNGSLMRLAPIPVFFSQNQAAAIEYAKQSSLTTHPGAIAAEACGFLSFLIQSAITSNKILEARSFLEERAATYAKILEPRAKENGVRQMLQLLGSKLKKNSTERNWNWKMPSLEIVKTLKRRGRSYNGYPVSRGYYGAYSMDGLALALYCVYNTTSFAAAVERVVNFMGDADSTGAIVGQIAGAIYGYESIPDNLLKVLKNWDNETVTLRAMLLFKAGCLEPKEQALQRSYNLANATDFGPEYRTKIEYEKLVQLETAKMLTAKLHQGESKFIVDYFEKVKGAVQDANILKLEIYDLSHEQIKQRVEYEVAFKFYQTILKKT